MLLLVQLLKLDINERLVREMDYFVITSYSIHYTKLYEAKLFAGAISGEDHIFINGKDIGSTSSITNPNDISSTNREYSVPLNLLKKGNNTIAIYVDFNINNILCPSDGNLIPPLVLSYNFV